MKKILKRILIALLALILVLAVAFCCVYFTRLRTLSSIEKITAYDDGYNLYRMNVQYDYNLDNIIAAGITDNQSFVRKTSGRALTLMIPPQTAIPKTRRKARRRSTRRFRTA